MSFAQEIEMLLKSELFTSMRITNLPQQLGLAPTTTDAQGAEHRVHALKIFYLQHTAYSAKECYRPGGGAKYISAISKVSLCEPNGAVVDVYRTELFDCGNFGACRQRGGSEVWREEALPGERLHCVFSCGNFINSKASHPSAKELGGIPKIAATNCSASASNPVAPAHTIVGVYADQPIISMTFDDFQPLCSAHGCASNAAGTHCSYARGQACKRATLPAYVMKHVILLRTPNEEDCWYVAGRRDPYLQYRFETLTLSKEATAVRDENPSESMMLRAARLMAAKAAASPKKRKMTADSAAAASSGSSSAAAAAAAGFAAAPSSSDPVLTPVESQQRIIDRRRTNKAATEDVEDAETKWEALPAARAYKPSKKLSRAGAGVGGAAAQPAAAAAAGRSHKRKSSVIEDDSSSSQSSSAASSRAPSISGKSKVRYALNPDNASSDEASSDEESDSAQVSSQQAAHSFTCPAVLARRGRPTVPPIQLPHRSINSHALYGLESPVGGVNNGFDWSMATPVAGPQVLASPEPMPSHHTLGARCTSGSMPLSTPPFCRTPARPSMSPMSGGSAGFLGLGGGRRRRSLFAPSSQPASGGWMSRSGSNTAVQPATPLTPSRVEPDETHDDTMQPHQLQMNQLQTQLPPSHDLIRTDGMLPMSSSNPTTPGMPAIPSVIPHHGGARNASMSSLLRSLTINIHSAVPAWPQPSPQLPYDTLASAPLAPTPLSAAPGEIDITMT